MNTPKNAKNATLNNGVKAIKETPHMLRPTVKPIVSTTIKMQIKPNMSIKFNIVFPFN